MMKRVIGGPRASWPSSAWGYRRGERGRSISSSVVSFDRAATFYDRTRSIPAGAMDQVVEQLLGELDGRGPALEIGVGTGRIALPLRKAGVAITGIDVSIAMMRVLVSKTAGHPPF